MFENEERSCLLFGIEDIFDLCNCLVAEYDVSMKNLKATFEGEDIVTVTFSYIYDFTEYKYIWVRDIGWITADTVYTLENLNSLNMRFFEEEIRDRESILYQFFYEREVINYGYGKK